MNTIGNFNCTCPDGFIQGEGIEQCQLCQSGYRPGELHAVNLGMAYSWKAAKDMCLNYEDGTYTLPVPDSLSYNEYISGLVSGHTEIPLGFSDLLKESNWINIYTGE